MAKGKSYKKKDVFADLDSDFKDKISGMDEAGIRNIIATVALNEEANTNNKKNDQDLKDKKDTAKFAEEGYKKASKMNKLRIKFAKRVLEDKGKPTEASLGV